ncbi:heme-binding domain-containing protein [Emticicia sp. BO119]|uniref:heme-binding domain-containing protein n=1 Tax=Emticicia sp. BO119 TaxID=2757768 RepID=UPI0015F10321|nr:heme-binding domain-containing protein [Emticicia sp. BO119]MBA4851701.1 heme-binding domain-containing protein [Emticicia sp. BO119]
MLKKILLGLGVILILIQFIRPEKNESNDKTHDISTKYMIPTEVNHLLEVACNDCHSNKTLYPWYSQIQPIAWWMNHHVEDGKRHLNFSTFTSLPVAVQNHKFEETIEMIDEKEMPLESYTFLGLHKEANLSDADRKAIIDWAKAQMDTLKANYPADSLKLKRRTPPPAN